MRRARIPVILALFGALLVPRPAGAAQLALDMGGFVGTFEVGKSGVCEEDGGGYVSGAGFGMPIVSGAKWGLWRFEGQVFSALYGSGWMQMCGKFGPLGQAPNSYGASCGAEWAPTKFYDGQGTIQYFNVAFQLSDVGAKYDRGSLFGRAWIDSMKNQGTIFFRKTGGDGNIECYEKWDNEKSSDEGATLWNLTAGYHITPLFSTGLSDYYDDPATCKDSSNPACPYETKQ